MAHRYECSQDINYSSNKKYPLPLAQVSDSKAVTKYLDVVALLLLSGQSNPVQKVSFT